MTVQVPQVAMGPGSLVFLVPLLQPSKMLLQRLHRGKSCMQMCSLQAALRSWWIQCVVRISSQVRKMLSNSVRL